MVAFCAAGENLGFNLSPGLSLQSFIVPSLIQNAAISTHEIHPAVSTLFKKLTVIEFGIREKCQRSMLNIYPSGDRLVIVYADNRLFVTHADVRNAVNDLIKSKIINFGINRDQLVSGILDGNDRGENDVSITLDFPERLTEDPDKDRAIYIRLAEYYKNIASVADTFVGPTGGRTYFNATQEESVTLLKFMGELYRDQPRLNFSIADGQAVVSKAIQNYEKAGKFYYSPPTHSRYISLQQLTEALDLTESAANGPRLIDNPEAFMARLDALNELLVAKSISNGAPEMMFLIFRLSDDNSLQFNDSERQADLLNDFHAKYDYTASFRDKPEQWHKNKDDIEQNWSEFLTYFKISTHPVFRTDDLTNPIQVRSLVNLIRGDTINSKVKEWVHGVSTPLVAEKLGYFQYHHDGSKEWIGTSSDKTLIAIGKFARELAHEETDCVVAYLPYKGILTRETRNPIVRRELGPSKDMSFVIETSSLNTNIKPQFTVFKLDPTSPEYFDKLKRSKSPHRASREWDILKTIPSEQLSEAAHVKRLSQFNLFQQLLNRLGKGLEVEPFNREIRETHEGKSQAILYRGWIPGELVSKIELSSRDNQAAYNLLLGTAELAAVNHYAVRNVFGRDELLVIEENQKLPTKLLHIGVNDSFTNILNFKSIKEHEDLSSVLNGATFSFMIACYIYGYYGCSHISQKKQELTGNLVMQCENHFREAAEKIRGGGLLDLELLRKAQSNMSDTIKSIPSRFSLKSGIELAQMALSEDSNRIATLNSAVTLQLMPLYDSVLGDINLSVERNTPEKMQAHIHKIGMVTRLASEVENLIKTNAADRKVLDKVFQFLDGSIIDFSRLTLDLRESLLFSANTILMLKYDESINVDKILKIVRTASGDEEFSELLKNQFPELELDTDIAQRFHRAYNSVINAKETYFNPNDNPIDKALEYILG